MELHRHSAHLVWFDLQPDGVPDFITIYIWLDEKNAIIETGPACALEHLMAGIAAAGLTPGEIDWVLPTHIHLDHFGGGGHLLRELPNARALVDPSTDSTDWVPLADVETLVAVVAGQLGSEAGLAGWAQTVVDGV